METKYNEECRGFYDLFFAVVKYRLFIILLTTTIYNMLYLGYNPRKKIYVFLRLIIFYFLFILFEVY